MIYSKEKQKFEQKEIIYLFETHKKKHVRAVKALEIELK